MFNGQCLYNMIHFGKNHEGDLQIIVSGSDVAALKRVIDAAPLAERRNFYNIKNYIETEYKDVIEEGGHHATV